MTRHTLSAFLGVAVLLLSSYAFAQPAYTIDRANPVFSLDIGSDLDKSDPTTPAFPSDNTLDCGDIHLGQDATGGGVPWSYDLYPPTLSPIIQGTQPPLLYKDDTGPTNAWNGWPLSTAPQPTPSQIGNDSIQSYQEYFDLDAEDQTSLESFNIPINFPQETEPRLTPVPELTLQEQAALGVYNMPPQVYLSFEDDGPRGWAVTPDIPTLTAPNHAYEAWADALPLQAIPGVPKPNPWATEHNLGLSPDPFDVTMANPVIDPSVDDDLDALDLHPDAEPEDGIPDHIYRERFWSADHEANMNLDPGDVFITRNGIGQNLTLAFDDGLHIGVPDGTGQDPSLDTDIDAFELLSITDESYRQLFQTDPLDPTGQPLTGNILVAIFSVDQDDTDTTGVNESGGLNPNIIYLTNLAGRYVALTNPYECDIDALAVIPEPATLALLAVGGLGVLLRRKC